MKAKRFKPSDFTYDPVRQNQRNMWMHSVEGHRTANMTARDYLLAFLGILTAVGAAAAIMVLL